MPIVRHAAVFPLVVRDDSTLVTSRWPPFYAPQPSPGCPSALRPDHPVPLFARDLRPASAITSFREEFKFVP